MSLYTAHNPIKNRLGGLKKENTDRNTTPPPPPSTHNPRGASARGATLNRATTWSTSHHHRSGALAPAAAPAPTEGGLPYRSRHALCPGTRPSPHPRPPPPPRSRAPVPGLSSIQHLAYPGRASRGWTGEGYVSHPKLQFCTGARGRFKGSREPARFCRVCSYTMFVSSVLRSTPCEFFTWDHSSESESGIKTMFHWIFSYNVIFQPSVILISNCCRCGKYLMTHADVG